MGALVCMILYGCLSVRDVVWVPECASEQVAWNHALCFAGLHAHAAFTTAAKCASAFWARGREAKEKDGSPACLLRCRCAMDALLHT